MSKHNQTGLILMLLDCCMCGHLCKHGLNHCFGLLRRMLTKHRDCFSLFASSKITSPDSKSWSDFLSPPNFPTSLLFFLSILLSLSLSSQMLQIFPTINSIGFRSYLKWRIPPASRQALEVILGGFATFCLERRSRKWTGDMLFPYCILQRKCSLVCRHRPLFLWKQRLSV